MGISVSLANKQAKSIRSNASELRIIQNNLKKIKADLNKCWIAEEMTYINLALDNAIGKLSSLAAKLDGISSDVISVAEQIKREEEEEERRRKARAQAQAQG